MASVVNSSIVNSFMAHLVSSRDSSGTTGCLKKSKTRLLSGGKLQKIQIRSRKTFESIASIEDHAAIFGDYRIIEGRMIGQDCNAIHRLKQVGCQLSSFERLTPDDNRRDIRVAEKDRSSLFTESLQDLKRGRFSNVVGVALVGNSQPQNF